MTTVYVVCEGQTEANFVKRVLNRNFNDRGVFFNSPIVRTGRDEKSGRVFKGGVSSFLKFKNTLMEILPLTKKSDVYATTMIDYYKIPSDTPGWSESLKIQDIYKRVEFLESEIQKGFPQYSKFFPYIQLHEFEALIFTNLDKLEEKYFDYRSKMKPLRKCLDGFSNPEMINTSEQTAPSKRIYDCIPVYNKCNMGVRILEETDFSFIRESCPHFNNWMKKIERIV